MRVEMKSNFGRVEYTAYVRKRWCW